MNLDDKKEDIQFGNDKKNKFKKKHLFLIVYLLIILALGYIAIPKIELNGSDKLIISYDEEYVEGNIAATSNLFSSLTVKFSTERTTSP